MVHSLTFVAAAFRHACGPEGETVDCRGLMKTLLITFLLAAGWCAARGAEAAVAAVPASGVKPVLFNTAFESGSIGLVEKLGAEEFRLHVRGQQDARGRNRQATWFCIRMDVAERMASGRQLIQAKAEVVQ